MSLHKIRIELGRCPEFPEGSRDHGYEFVAPLGRESRIDAEEWRGHKKACRVHRFWAGENDEIGHLVRRRNGGWAFHYDLEGDPDADEDGFRFGDHPFSPGDYVSITEHDGVLRTFRVVSTQRLET